MSFRMITALGLIALLVLFVVANHGPLTVDLLVGKFRSSVAVVLLAVFGAGLVTGILLRGK